MKAMIFAAGRGERMRPLTDACPKPLLPVRGKPLIVWHIQNLVRAGISEIVINHSHLGAMIEDKLGDGSRFGARIVYSPEASALETAGGIARALPLLGEQPFLALAGDIHCPQFDFSQAHSVLEENDPWGNPLPQQQRDLGWLYLVRNPVHHPEGDFALNSFAIANQGQPRYTFSGIGVYRPELFAGIDPNSPSKLAPLLRQYADQGRIGGDVYRGPWTDVGTVERLNQLNAKGIRP